jgi:hypothetical protein
MFAWLLRASIPALVDRQATDAGRGQAGCFSASICRSHDAIRFQLALVWSTFARLTRERASASHLRAKVD